jgi:hypothetical protein
LASRPFRISETVVGETPAALPTSVMVGREAGTWEPGIEPPMVVTVQ